MNLTRTTKSKLPFLRWLTAVFLPTLLPAATTESSELAGLRAQVQQLQAQLEVLARKIAAQEDAAAANATPAAARATATDRGYAITSTDAADTIRLRGLVQLDSRVFRGGDAASPANGFVLRRARLISEGTLAKDFSFQLVTEFGGSGVSILDADLTLALTPSLQLKAGKFKVPIGYEWLQTDAWTFFSERSLVTNLVPARDLGVQLSGDLFAGRASYTVGIFNGVADLATTNNADFDNEKDFAGRVVAAPFRQSNGSPLRGLSFGIGGSTGRQKTAAGRTSGYRTDGQQPFFTYDPGVVADGRIWRVSPQLDYRHGPLGVLGEYVLSTANLRPTATAAKTALQHRAWQIAAGYVLTGEDSSYSGVVPRENFSLAAHTWGAFEIAARYANLQLDDAAFPAFATPDINPDEARSAGLGCNWYLSKAVALKVDYFRTKLGFHPPSSAPPATAHPRSDEQAFITRLQLGF